MLPNKMRLSMMVCFRQLQFLQTVNQEGEMDEDRVEHRAVDLVVRYYTSKGWKVTNVSRARGEHGGYDLIAAKGSGQITIEVKGCTRPYGIPDPYITEFDAESRRLIADVLCVAYFLSDMESPRLAIIPRDAIPPEYVVPKFGYRISGKFKNARTISRYFVEL